jgi:lipopolysaccharide/colanic/teichoic acid biosynthesis glycosyltransferase
VRILVVATHASTDTQTRWQEIVDAWSLAGHEVRLLGSRAATLSASAGGRLVIRVGERGSDLAHSLRTCIEAVSEPFDFWVLTAPSDPILVRLAARGRPGRTRLLLELTERHLTSGEWRVQDEVDLVCVRSPELRDTLINQGMAPHRIVVVDDSEGPDEEAQRYLELMQKPFTTQRGWPLLVKRAIDRLAGGLGLVATAPVIGAAALALHFQNGGSPFFVQERPGRHGRPFRVVKLKTMRDATDAAGRVLPDEDRLTPLGQWLRERSIDELPQLLNVLKGELSLVGPRPLLMRYLSRYTSEQARRHEVLPGITGWAQVNGRNAISWEEKFSLDVWYVDHWSLALDATILLKTVTQVLHRSGISNQESATMPEFLGVTSPTTR